MASSTGSVRPGTWVVPRSDIREEFYQIFSRLNEDDEPYFTIDIEQVSALSVVVIRPVHLNGWTRKSSLELTFNALSDISSEYLFLEYLQRKWLASLRKKLHLSIYHSDPEIVTVDELPAAFPPTLFVPFPSSS